MIITILYLVSSVHAANLPNAQELLQQSDRARGATAGLAGLTWDTSLNATENGQKSEMKLLVKVKGTQAVAETLEPARQRGELILFNDRTIWYYKPGLKKPVSISPRQRMMGQAANGDIAATNYAGDYEPEHIESADAKTWKLDLKAKEKNVTYDRINYWISKKDKVGIRAEFLTVSGEIFKKAEFKYGNKINLNSSSVPFVSQMTIRDAKNDKNVTTLTYKNPREEALSDAMFNVNNLIK